MDFGRALIRHLRYWSESESDPDETESFTTRALGSEAATTPSSGGYIVQGYFTLRDVVDEPMEGQLATEAEQGAEGLTNANAGYRSPDEEDSFEEPHDEGGQEEVSDSSEQSRTCPSPAERRGPRRSRLALPLARFAARTRANCSQHASASTPPRARSQDDPGPSRSSYKGCPVGILKSLPRGLLAVPPSAHLSVAWSPAHGYGPAVLGQLSQARGSEYG